MEGVHNGPDSRERQERCHSVQLPAVLPGRRLQRRWSVGHHPRRLRWDGSSPEGPVPGCPEGPDQGVASATARMRVGLGRPSIHKCCIILNMKADKNLLKRLKIVEGQVRGVREMLENDKYCIDIITQTSAIRSALSSIEDVMMECHLNGCVVDQIKKGKEKFATKEILKVYRLKRK
jgi:CsoR family transcriptional regulator, copper-sensing transcriptional repressor